jgi:hypothetical protein
MLELSPAGRGGTPDEVATVAALLMGPDGAFITGSDVLMDGRRPDVVDHNAVIFMQPEGPGGIRRIADGRVAEIRGTADRLGMLTSSGFCPTWVISRAGNHPRVARRAVQNCFSVVTSARLAPMAQRPAGRLPVGSAPDRSLGTPHEH